MVVSEHDSSGTIIAKANFIFELAALYGIVETLRIGAFVDNQVAIHPVTKPIVLHNDAPDTPVIQWQVASFKNWTGTIDQIVQRRGIVFR